MEQESQQDHDKGDILRMADSGVRTGSRQFMAPLGVIENIPCGGKQIEAIAEKHITCDMQDTKMRIALFA